MRLFTYIWMTANSLDNILIEVSRVTKKTAGDVVSMFESAECSDGELRPLGQIPLS